MGQIYRESAGGSVPDWTEFEGLTGSLGFPASVGVGPRGEATARWVRYLAMGPKCFAVCGP